MADNIITAVFGATRETKVRPRYRYDVGQILVVKGVPNLPDFYEVHFANEGSTADATPLIGTAEGVEIPGTYFQSGATIYAYIYVHDEATDGTTIYRVTIPIINRARPANIEPTQEQEDIIAQAIIALNENVGRAEDAAEQAEASAESVEAAADGVETLTARAEAAAQAAEASETNASSSATTAQSAAQAAAGRASDAYAYLEVAVDAANRANSKASSAEQSSNTARSYATQAQTAKQGAETAKTDAQTARTQAQGYRQAAEAAANRAETAAEEITGMTAEAETLEPGSPATASFLDGVLSLGIPAGAPGADGDDGNGIVSIVKTGTSGNVDTYTITYTNGTTSTFTVTNSAVQSVAGKTGAVTLDAGDVSFDDQQPYNDGTVGAGLADLKSHLDKYTGVETVPFVPGGYIATNGAKAYINTIVPSTGYQYIVAECKDGDMVHVTGSGGSTPRLWAFVDADDNVLAKADASLSATDLALTAPEGTKYLVVNDLNSANALVTVGKYVPEIESEIYNDFNVQSENLFNPATYIDGKYVSPLYGTLITEATMCCTDFIEVKQGDILTFGNGALGVSVPARFICAYNNAKTVIQDSGSSEAVTSYTVPNNVCFVRISFSKSLYANGFFPWISKTGTIKYMPYYSGTVRDLARNNYSGISGIVNWPLASFPAYIRNQLSYKPIGTLSKGYVLLTSDDGQAPLATYTLPMLIAKGVPVTMGVMAESQILNNETYAAVFVDAVENHGCSVAAHGVQAYTQYSEYQLNKFFDEQDALISQFGLTIDGAICPTHAINETVKAVAGGRYGVVRTATFNGVPSYGGNNYLAGPRSNIYALPSESIIGYDLNYHKTAMDLAKDNHWIRVLYWHDDDLTEQYKTLLEGTIDYALSIGLEFITFKDLANNLII